MEIILRGLDQCVHQPATGRSGMFEEMIFDPDKVPIGFLEEKKNHTILAKATTDLCLFEPRFGYKLCEDVWEGRDESFIDICQNYSYHGITLDMQDCIALKVEKYDDANYHVEEHSISLIPISRIIG